MSDQVFDTSPLLRIVVQNDHFVAELKYKLAKKLCNGENTEQKDSAPHIPTLLPRRGVIPPGVAIFGVESSSSNSLFFSLLLSASFRSSANCRSDSALFENSVSLEALSRAPDRLRSLTEKKTLQEREKTRSEKSCGKEDDTT